MGSPVESDARPGAGRQLGLVAAAAVVIGEIIGVGIFLAPAGMTRTLGAPLWVLGVWLAMGAMVLCGALCYGELAARLPEAGGGYAYLRQAYGRRVAFLYGWKCLLVLDPGITAALGVGGAAYASRIVPLSHGGQKLAAIAAIVALGAVNLLGLRLGSAVLRVLVALKLGLLAFLVAWSLVRGLGDWSHFLPLAQRRLGSPPLVEALSGALVAAFFAFGGWWDLCKLGGEVRAPERTIPRALVLGVLVVTVVYLLTSAVFLYLVPVEAVTSDVAFAAQVGAVLFGGAGERVFAAIVVISVLGSLASLTLAAPRVYYAMARDGLFFSALAELHPRLGTPARAIALQAVLAGLLVALGTFEEILGVFLLVTVLFIALTVAGVLTRCGTRPGAAPRIPLHPLPALLFLALAALLGTLLVLGQPRESLLGLALVALGWPIYALVFPQRMEPTR